MTMGTRIRILLLALLAFAPAAHSQTVSVSTDLLGYADRLTLNGAASVALSRRWTANLELRYNPFSFKAEEGNVTQTKQRSAYLGGRFWPWHVYSGWWMGAGLRLQEYSRSPRHSPETTEGLRMGAGFAGGYSYMLTTWLNLELAAGLWAGWDRYRQYDCPRCGAVVEEGERPFLLPYGTMLNLSVIF